LIGTPAASIASFYQVSPLAAALFAPTQIWVTIAAKLNYDIVRLNKKAEK
jgi:benzodiazapine receptor